MLYTRIMSWINEARRHASRANCMQTDHYPFRPIFRCGVAVAAAGGGGPMMKTGASSRRRWQQALSPWQNPSTRWTATSACICSISWIRDHQQQLIFTARLERLSVRTIGLNLRAVHDAARKGDGHHEHLHRRQGRETRMLLHGCINRQPRICEMQIFK